MESRAPEIPIITSGKTIFDKDGMITDTKFTLCEANAPAILLGTYPRAFVASSTLARVLADTSLRFLNTRLTVISDTPEASETSRRVRGRFF